MLRDVGLEGTENAGNEIAAMGRHETHATAGRNIA